MVVFLTYVEGTMLKFINAGFGKVKSNIKKFKNDLKGSFAIITAIVGAVMVFAIGAAVDYTNFLTAQNVAVKALDTASLAAAVELDEGGSFSGTDGAEEQARDIFALNVQDSRLIDVAAVTSSLSVAQTPGSNEVVATADVVVPTFFAGLFGFNEISSTVSSTAGFEDEITEFVFVLDTTGSMNSSIPGSSSRIEALRTAMTNTINLVFPDPTSDTVRVGIVPYAISVNAGSFYSDAVNQYTDSFIENTTNTCVTEREGEGLGEFRDIAPFTGAANRAEALMPDNLRTYYETDSALRNGPEALCPSVAIRPLTNNRADLMADIRALTAAGSTAGHIGINWGLNLLSENWQSFWPADAQPAPYRTSNVRKVLVVMTDGEFNQHFYDSRSGNRVNISNAAALEFCDVAKETARNIEIYTIAFGEIAEDDGTPSTAENLLRQCATDEDHFLPAINAGELQSAFASIIEQTISPRLTQ